jgi:hypothetical protein
MRAWFRWFLGLSGPERWGIVGTILTAIGLVVGIVSLIPAYTGSVSSLPAPAPSPPVAQAAPEKVASSDPKPAAARGDAPPQQITGNDNIQIGSIKDVRDVTINPKPKMRIRTVLQNAGSNISLVLREIDEDPKTLLEYATDEEKRLGFVPVGTEVKVLPEKRNSSKNPALASYTKLEILEGEHKGQVGWASMSNIKSETLPE